jgi:hypothetical protein
VIVVLAAVGEGLSVGTTADGTLASPGEGVGAATVTGGAGEGVGAATVTGGGGWPAAGLHAGSPTNSSKLARTCPSLFLGNTRFVTWNEEVSAMLRRLFRAFPAKNSDTTEASRLSVVRRVDNTPQFQAQADAKQRYPKSVCTSLKDLCEL